MKRIFLLTLALLSAIFPYAQGLQWAYKFGGSTSDVGYGITVDKNNFIYLTGNFELGADFDPGPAFANLSASGSSDIFIQKLRDNGNLVWAKRVGGSGADSGQAIATDDQGNIYLTGYFSGVADFDPGPASNYLQSAGDWDIFVLKLNRDGEFQWVRSMGGTGTDSGRGIAVDAQGNVYVTGYFAGTANFDPGGSDFTLDAANGSIFIQKFNAAGQFAWAVQSGASMGQTRGWSLDCDQNGRLYVGGDGHLQRLNAADGTVTWKFNFGGSGSSCTSVKVDAQGNLHAAGYFTGMFPLGDTTLSANTSTTFILKLDPDGNCLNCPAVSGTSIVWGYALALDEAGNSYTLGWYTGQADFDPGPGEAILSSPNGYSAFLLHLNSAGQFVSVAPFQISASSNRVEGYSIATDRNGGIYALGRLNGTADFNPSPVLTTNLTASGFFDIFLAKLYTRGAHRGTVFQDLNANQVQDAGEPGLPNVIVRDRNRNIFVSSDNSGIYQFYTNVSGDTLNMIRPASRPYWSAAPAFAIADSLQNKDFAVTVLPVRDLSISAAEITIFRPGFETVVQITVQNIGSLPVDSIPVSLLVTAQTAPEPLAFVSAAPAPATQSANEITWQIPHLDAGGTAVIKVKFKTPASVPVRTPLGLSISAYIPADAYPANNSTRMQRETIGSLDPNDKQVTPALVLPQEVDTTDLLYVVRFQNTGTFPADLVVIRDTLPEGLDLSTLQVAGASHAHTWRLYDGRLLEVRFDPIALPDSTSDEPGSHGFVAFTVRPEAGLAPGDSIGNRAGIYFDYNAPVITNTTVMRVALPPSGVTGPALPDWLDFGLRPNPAPAQGLVTLDLPEVPTSQSALIRVSDRQGKMIREMSAGAGERQVTLAGLPAGVYLVQVKAGARLGVKMLVVE